MGAGLIYSGFTYYLFGFLSPVYWGWEAETLIATTMLGVVMHLIERRQKNELET